jgi:PAS domain S-box-containing protein
MKISNILKLPDLSLNMDLLKSPEYIILVSAAVIVCILLAWNFIVRKRFARYRHLSSSQGERYRQFFDNCPDALLVVEHEGSIVSANARACSLLKMDSQDMLARTFWNFVSATTRPEFSKQFTQCIAGKKMHCEGEIQASDGTVIPVEVNGSLHYVHGSKLVQLYIRDISDFREVEDQVRSLYNQLDKTAEEAETKEKKIAEEISVARKELIAFANHRIRTPLDGIMGMAQLLADSALSIEQRNYVYTILNSSGSLLDVIRTMGELTEEESDEVEPQDEFVNLRETCKALYRKFEPLAALKGIDLRCSCQSNVPLQVVADERLLSRVLANMLDNAIKFTEQGLVMLSIECRRMGSDSTELYFHVIDTGWGIDKEFQSIIFEKAEQQTGTGVAQHAGLGMDLATSRKVIERMGGTIGLDSTKGKGSTFYFNLTFPLSLAEPAVNVPEEPQAVPEPRRAAISDTAVLVVEDNRISQKVVVAMLQKAGCEVDAVSNGKAALAQVRKKSYDLILMDCQMPVMDGFKATTAIRAMAEPIGSTPIIALTAHTLKHELQACRNCGMDDHLVKPVDRQLLIDTVQDYVGKGRQTIAVPRRAAS